MTRRKTRTDRRDSLTRALARTIGLEREQLELALVPDPQAVRKPDSPEKYAECGRWNYHTIGCPRRSPTA